MNPGMLVLCMYAVIAKEWEWEWQLSLDSTASTLAAVPGVYKLSKVGGNGNGNGNQLELNACMLTKSRMAGLYDTWIKARQQRFGCRVLRKNFNAKGPHMSDNLTLPQLPKGITMAVALSSQQYSRA